MFRNIEVILLGPGRVRLGTPLFLRLDGQAFSSTCSGDSSGRLSKMEPEFYLHQQNVKIIITNRDSQCRTNVTFQADSCLRVCFERSKKKGFHSTFEKTEDKGLNVNFIIYLLWWKMDKRIGPPPLRNSPKSWRGGGLRSSCIYPGTLCLRQPEQSYLL